MTSNEPSSAGSGLSPEQAVVIEELAERIADLQTIATRLQARLDDHEAGWRDLSELAAQLAAQLESAQRHGREPGETDQEQAEPDDGQLPLFGLPPEPPAPSGSGQALGAAVPHSAAETADHSPDQDSSQAAKAPTFIVLFDPGSDEERQEILALDEWVTQVLVPTYVTRVSSRQPWCAQWWDHPEALARIHALWLAWQELTDETAGGHTGPSLWHRDHLDDAMTRLRSHDGPFAACMIDPQTPSHRTNRATPVEPYEPSHQNSAAPRAPTA